MGIMPSGCAIPEDIKEQAKALYLQGLSTGDVARETGVPYGAIRTWIKRGKWGSLRIATHQIAGPAKEMAVTRSLSFAPVQLATRMPDAAPSRLRGVISREIEAQVAVLEQNPPESLLELKNTPDREGRASMVKRIAETAALVENWEDHHAPGIIVMMEPSQPIEETIDIQSIQQSVDPAAEAIRALQAD